MISRASYTRRTIFFAGRTGNEKTENFWRTRRRQSFVHVCLFPKSCVWLMANPLVAVVNSDNSCSMEPHLECEVEWFFNGIDDAASFRRKILALIRIFIKSGVRVGTLHAFRNKKRLNLARVETIIATVILNIPVAAELLSSYGIAEWTSLARWNPVLFLKSLRPVTY